MESTYYVRPTRRLAGTEFGRDELRQVGISAAGLTLVFSAGFAHGIMSAGFSFAFLNLLPLAFLAVVPSFFAALLVQKRVGERNGCTVEFRLQRSWLGIAILFAFLAGFVFAITGATSRFGKVTRDGAGRMSASATGTYLAASIIALALFASGGPSQAGSFFAALFVVMASVNSFLAIFSLIPVFGFPGADVWRWSPVVYLALLGAVAAALAVSFNPGVLT